MRIAWMERAVLMICVSVSAAVIGVARGAADEVENPARSAALLAFAAQPGLEKELDALESQGYRRGPVQAIGLGGFCGVAGCDSSFLVAIVLSRGRGELSKQILANVTVRAPGFSIVDVRRVQLVAVGRIGDVTEGVDE